MNRLYCQVTNCRHNDSDLCCLNRIKVEGPGAHSTSGTCCASFAERNSAAENSAAGGRPAPETDISCKAKHCVYNENCSCCAESVDVSCCCSEPRAMSETECLTFRSR